jgi:predicted DNA-binding transcriptional regulator AlpA
MGWNCSIIRGWRRRGYCQKHLVPPNPETGKIRQVDLDIPVVFKKTQLYVFTKDIENLSFETTSQNEEGLSKRRPRLKSATTAEPTPPDLEDEITKIAKPIKPVETTSNSVETETRYLTIKEVMKLAGIGRQTIYDAIKAGRFPKQVYPTGSRAARWDKSAVIRAMAQVRGVLERDGESKFTLITPDGLCENNIGQRTINRLGFRLIQDDGSTVFWMLTEMYKQVVCHGFDPKLVTGVLRDKGYLEIDSAGKSSVSKLVPGLGRMRVYVIKASFMQDQQ